MNGPQAGPSASSSFRPRVRLNKEGSTLLSNYSRTLTSNPTRAEKEALLASLRVIPGNEEFTYQKLTGWFARRRSSGNSRVVLVDDETILFPKLTPIHLQQLRVLYKKRTDPSDAIVTFWAERLRAEKAEVAAWIQYQQTKARDEVCVTPESLEMPLQQLVGDPLSDNGSASLSPTFPRPHLPTPAKSPSVSPQTRIPSLPPIAVKIEEPRQCLSPVSPLDTPSFSDLRPTYSISPIEPRSALDGIPPLSRLPQQQVKSHPVSPAVTLAQPHVGRQPHEQDSSKTLAASIKDSLRLDATPGEQPPRTAVEFSEKFENVEEMINAFMNKYDSGRLAPLGWDSSLSGTVP